MKKILITLALAALCGGLSLQASPVSPERALDVARKVLSAQKATRAASGDVKIIWDGEYATKADVQPAIYVVAREGGGWVMVAGDDNVRPVLGLSYDGQFKTEGMPDNVKWWMDMTKAYVRSVTVQEPGVDVQWAKFVDTKAADYPDNEDGSPNNSITVLRDRRTPEWDQGNNDNYYFDRNVFNAFCPEAYGELTVTGCVATALAEVLTYQSGQDGVTMPIKGTGTVGGYTPNANGFYSNYPPVAPGQYTLGEEDHNYEYNWAGLISLSKISDISSALSNTDLIDNLGHLMADLGAVMHANYNTNQFLGTSASTSMIPYYMNRHFGFNGQAYYDMAANYDSDQWVAKLRNEIDKRPIIYSGSTAEQGGSGHAFVLDGYGTLNDATLFHVNLGWGGNNNGYYYLSNVNNGNGSYYNRIQGAVFDFYPAPGTEVPILEASYSEENPGYFIGIKLLPNNNKYYVYYLIHNISEEAYNGQIQFKVQHRDGTVNEISNSTINFSCNPNQTYGSGFGPVTIQSGFGDRVVCFYKDGDDWKLLRGTPGSVIDEWALVPVAFIDVNNSYNQGDVFTFRLKNYNERYRNTVWTVTSPSGTVTTYQQSDRNFILSESGKYKIQAAVADADINSGAVAETLETYITVAGN